MPKINGLPIDVGVSGLAPKFFPHGLNSAYGFETWNIRISIYGSRERTALE
jgi:hypothetical protein